MSDISLNDSSVASPAAPTPSAPSPSAPAPNAPAPTLAASAAPRPPLPTEPPPFLSGSPAAEAQAAGGGAVRKPRLLTAEQREELSELAQQRGAVKQQQVKKKELIEAAAEEEMKISAAIAGRSVVAQQGVKDLQLFVANISRIEAGSAKSMSAISVLFAEETSSTAEALKPFLSSCKELEALHTDLHKVLSSVETKRAEESAKITDEQCKSMKASCARMLTDLTGARKAVQVAFACQEKAWDACVEAGSASQAAAGVVRKSGPPIELDPWLSSLQYQTSLKGLETIETDHALALKGLLGELRDMDRARLQGLKGIMMSYATARKAILEKALQNAQEMCAAAEALDPDADCLAWLEAQSLGSDVLLNSSTASVDSSAYTPGGENDFSQLSQSNEAERLAGGAGHKETKALGVWIPDEVARKCGKCAAVFTILRRKHHCRRCGKVFCGPCSSKTKLLPPHFGFGTTPQRVCDLCSDTSDDSSSSSDPSAECGFSHLDFEVAKAGPLLKKGGMLSKDAVQKPKYFVCTKAGFLHSLDSKFDSLPRESVPLHSARVSTVDDDACAFAIEYHSTPDPDAKGLFKGRGKVIRCVFRSALGTNDRDEWIATLRGCSDLEA